MNHIEIFGEYLCNPFSSVLTRVENHHYFKKKFFSFSLKLSELTTSGIVIFHWFFNETGIFDQLLIFQRGLKWVLKFVFLVATKYASLNNGFIVSASSFLFTEETTTIDFQLDCKNGGVIYFELDFYYNTGFKSVSWQLIVNSR